MENKLRQTITNRLLNSFKHNQVLELSTGMGKTKLALDKINQLYSPNCKILIVIPRNVLIQNWIEEFKKWHYEDILSNVTFVTYVSLPKMAGSWDIVCFDECHHLSERCREAITEGFTSKHCLFLSATISKDVREFIHTYFKDTEWINVNTRKAIESQVLPDPKIILIPLQLDNTRADCFYAPRKLKGDKPLIVPYAKKWEYKSYKGDYVLQCTQKQYYMELSGIIEWYKRKNFIPAMKNLWLHKAGERLKWLSDQKLETVLKLTSDIKSRKLVFCNTIEQSELLGFPCVNSKVGIDNLELFNKGKVNAISCVNMLDEGQNLHECPCGVFMSLNSSQRMQVQKVGRLLRHSDPVIYIPYFVGTREEEIVSKMIEGYNKDLISTMFI